MRIKDFIILSDIELQHDHHQPIDHEQAQQAMRDDELQDMLDDYD